MKTLSHPLVVSHVLPFYLKPYVSSCFILHHTSNLVTEVIMELKNKVAIVTGAASGMGKAIATLYATQVQA